MAVDQMAVDQMAVDQMSVGQMTRHVEFDRSTLSRLCRGSLWSIKCDGLIDFEANFFQIHNFGLGAEKEFKFNSGSNR